MNKKLELALSTALSEIGPIKPVWHEEDEMWGFEHPSYPVVSFLDEEENKVKEGYLRILKDFLQERIDGTVADFVEKMTPGHGGRRSGSGRRKHAIPKLRIYIPEDVAMWLKEDEKHIEQVRKKLMKA
jgi:hypothetical protein